MRLPKSLADQTPESSKIISGWAVARRQLGDLAREGLRVHARSLRDPETLPKLREHVALGAGDPPIYSAIQQATA